MKRPPSEPIGLTVAAAPPRGLKLAGVVSMLRFQAEFYNWKKSSNIGWFCRHECKKKVTSEARPSKNAMLSVGEAADGELTYLRYIQKVAVTALMQALPSVTR